MKHQTLSVLPMLLALACGSPDESFEPLQLAEAEQGIVAELNGGGWRLDGEQVQKLCSGGGGAAQKCLLPPSKTVRVQLNTAGMLAADVTIATAQFNGLISLLNTQFSGTGWSWVSVSSSPNVRVSDGTVSNFVGTSDIRAHVRLACSNLSGALTEIQPLTGTFHRCQTIQATVDYDKIFATFGAGNTTQVIKHAIGSAFMAGASIGVNAGHTGKITSQATSSANKSSTVQAVERCRMLSLNVNDQANVDLVNTCS